MQFITGGTFNGKSRWVKENIDREREWLKLFHSETMPHPAGYEGLVVMEGLEYLVLSELRKGRNGDDVRMDFLSLFLKWKSWEDVSANEIIWIGSDISKGIVPIEAETRLWRDVTGWVYQDLVRESKEVYEIWFGLPTLLKG
ncbi:bifunctional adenosylcobinamide kinase/adenosylcobinamide-phosphate guanylyltransferase [Bacillus salacetis]|uniref:bifunctional adenosylcobinamide kinase/adenosylcobinamide-phosphate guanylyltransferase n=1 Tax=Bacillus salacetis TaxID=2315464 RepID=UPI003B9E10C7